MNTLAAELETLGFQVKHPLRNQILNNAIIRAQGHNSAMLTKITDQLEEQLNNKKIKK